MYEDDPDITAEMCIASLICKPSPAPHGLDRCIKALTQRLREMYYFEAPPGTRPENLHEFKRLSRAEVSSALHDLNRASDAMIQHLEHADVLGTLHQYGGGAFALTVYALRELQDRALQAKTHVDGIKGRQRGVVRRCGVSSEEFCALAIHEAFSLFGGGRIAAASNDDARQAAQALWLLAGLPNAGGDDHWRRYFGDIRQSVILNADFAGPNYNPEFALYRRVMRRSLLVFSRTEAAD